MSNQSKTITKNFSSHPLKHSAGNVNAFDFEETYATKFMKTAKWCLKHQQVVIFSVFFF